MSGASRRDQQWWAGWLSAVEEFRAEHGHGNVPSQYRTTNGSWLGDWLRRCRELPRRHPATEPSPGAHGSRGRPRSTPGESRGGPVECLDRRPDRLSARARSRRCPGRLRDSRGAEAGQPAGRLPREVPEG
ncbi:helicase associated domain-containing protein [Nocardia carnea]|uniref:helicase associated domain-containing protein n=1 Tax=Nocardia carnea TaxID=37328 RepID=UPI0009DA90F4